MSVRGPVRSSVTFSDLHSVIVSEPSQSFDMKFLLADMVADIEVDKVADMEVDMVADMIYIIIFVYLSTHIFRKIEFF